MQSQHQCDFPTHHVPGLQCHVINKLKTSGQNFFMKGRIACCAVIKDKMISFTVYIADETVNAYQWARQPPKLPLLVEECQPQSNTWFLAPTLVSPPPKRHLYWFSHFCRAYT